jgi:hypothetical protein
MVMSAARRVRVRVEMPRKKAAAVPKRAAGIVIAVAAEVVTGPETEKRSEAFVRRGIVVAVGTGSEVVVRREAVAVVGTGIGSEIAATKKTEDKK